MHPKMSAGSEEIVQSIRNLAQSVKGDSLALLALLRLLEELHREIREDLFQTALPDNRQALYALLKDIESTGGWPYIQRMRLQDLLKRLSSELQDNLEPGRDSASVETEID